MPRIDTSRADEQKPSRAMLGEQPGGAGGSLDQSDPDHTPGHAAAQVSGQPALELLPLGPPGTCDAPPSGARARQMSSPHRYPSAEYCVSERAGIVPSFKQQSMARRIIVIPAYNEALTIADVVRGAVRIADRVLVVDDGSRDETGLRAKSAGALVVRHAVNRGVGAALGTGIEAAIRLGADAVVTMDADGQHRAEDAAKVFERLAQGDVDFVIGSRMKRGEDDAGHMPAHRVLFNTIGNLLTFFLFGVWVTDSQSGLRGLSHRAASTIELRTNGMESLSEFIKEMKDKRWRLAEVPIKAIYTDYSMSKGQNFFVGVRVAIRLIWRRFFG
jgi:hypothetical protein